MKKALLSISSLLLFIWFASADVISITWESVEYTVKYPVIQWYCVTDQELFSTQQYIPYIKDAQKLRMIEIKLDSINTAMINYNNMNKSCYPDPSQVWRYKNPRTICPDTTSPLNNICSLERDAIEYITNAYNEAKDDQKRANETFGSFLKQADEYANNKNYSKAIEYYKKALDLKDRAYAPSETVAQINNAIKSLEAQQTLKEVEDNWNDLTDKYNKVKELSQQYKYDEALKLCNEILSKEWKVEWWDNYKLVREMKALVEEWLAIQETAKKAEEQAKKEAAEAEVKKTQDEKDAEIQKAKEYLWNKAAIFEWLVPLFKEKDMFVQARVKTLLETFKLSKDPYTKNIGIYFGYLVE